MDQNDTHDIDINRVARAIQDAKLVDGHHTSAAAAEACKKQIMKYAEYYAQKDKRLRQASH